MKWKIEISKPAQKFIGKNNIPDCVWKDFFRIRMGKVRIIFKVDFESKNIFVDRIDFRGDAYK